MAVIAVDVDFTVVWLREHYWEWLESITSTKRPVPEGDISYDYTLYFQDALEKVGRCGLDYFRQDGLYDTLHPMEGAVEVLEWVSGKGHEVVFVSAIKGRHSKSKYEFLKRNFPFLSGVVFTKEKQYVQSHVFIDDRTDNVNKSSAPVKILFDAGHLQYETLVEGAAVLRDWREIGSFLYKEILDW